MERTEKIKRFMLMTQMWGYFNHEEPDRAAIVKMDNAIKGDVNFDTLAEAYNRLFLDEKWVQINRQNDLEEYERLMSMTEEEFAEEYFEVEGYNYK